jgi:hypothetical protein
MNSIKLLWLNAQRSNFRLHAILNSNKKADIILVQEPWFGTINTTRSDTDPSGTQVLGTVANPLWEILYPRSLPGQRCKVVAYRRIASTHFTVTNRIDLSSNYHLMTLDVHTDHETFRIYNIYHDACTSDKNEDPSQTSWATRVQSLHDILSIDIDPLIPTIIGGDFNTHSRSWSPQGVRQSPWALDIEEWAVSQTLDLINHPGTPTRHSDSRQKDSTIDLIWVNEAATIDDSFRDLRVDFAASLGSDHAGMWITHHLPTTTTDTTTPLNPPYMIQDAAHKYWLEVFRANLRLPPLSTSADHIEAEAARLSQHIEDTSMSTFQPRHAKPIRCAYWWNDSCREAVTRVRNANSDDEKRAANKALKSAIKTAKQEWADDFLKDATTEKLWTAARWRHGRRMRSIPALSTDSGLSNDTSTMTAALKQRFFKEPSPIPTHDVDDQPALPQRAFIPVTENEIEEALKPTSNKSAPGRSGHGYKLVKWAWEASPTWFVILFNSCLLAGYHPKVWRTATIAVVPKPGKSDYSLPKSYRPVALLECLSKLLEKVVAKRILHDIGLLNLVPTNQFGARPHSSAIHAGIALTHDIAVTHAQGGCCASIQFDIQGFFDNINHDRLVHTFRRLGFAENLCGWLSSFLSGRTVQLRFNAQTSDPIDISIGAPQGSPVSPILSIVYTADLLLKAETWPNTKMYMFIDDGNILVSGPSYRMVTNTLAENYRACLTWLRKVGLSIESEKTDVIFYSPAKPRPDSHGQRPASITIPSTDDINVTIQATDNVRYLGLYINHKLNWHQHVKIMATRARGSLKALQLLGNSIRGLNHGNWRLAYNAVCLLVLTYGSPVWYNGQKSLSDILQQVQDYAVRRILGAFCTTPAAPLHQLCAILPMHIRLQMLSRTAALSLLSVPHSSQLIQRLGPPWCKPEDLCKGFPNCPYPAPPTSLTHLTKLVPPESCSPPNYKYGPWVRRMITSDRLTLDTNTPQGEERRQRAREIAAADVGRRVDVLTLFCHGACPCNREGTPIAVAAATASYKGKTMDTLTRALGPLASSNDAATHALSLATALAIPALHANRSITHIQIFTTNPILPKQCLNRNTTAQPLPGYDFTQALTNILDTYHQLRITIGWVPPGKGLKSVAKAKSAAAATARRTSYNNNNPPPPPTKDQLHSITRADAIERWQDQWHSASRLQPAYLALPTPPDGKTPPFIKGLATHPRSIFCTGIRLLTTHAFTGEYSARFRPTSNDPQHCECGEPLQTAHHILTSCPRYTEARSQHLLTLSSAASLSLLFGSEKGGMALGAFIAATQACVQPRRADPAPEDHG